MNIKLLNNLDFGKLINAEEAISEAGNEILKSYRGHLYTSAPTFALVNGFLVEASKCQFDSNVMKIVESVKSFINENPISWQLASVCESLESNTSKYNYINKIGIEQVSKLLEMNESDVVSYIKAGALKNIQYIPEFRKVCKDVFKQQITEAHTANYNIINPVGYVFVNESNERFFNVLGKTYKFAEDKKIHESLCDDPKFIKVNKLLESFKREGENIFVEMNLGRGDKIKFEINENGLTLSKTGFGKEINETFGSVVEFQEYSTNLSKVMSLNEKLSFLNVVNSVSEVFEAFDNIVLLDNVKIILTESCTCAIIEGQNNVNLNVAKNFKYGSGSFEYDYMVEALNQVIKFTGIDLKGIYENRINEDIKKLNPEEKELKEQLLENKKAQYNIRKKKIAMLAEQYKNDPVKIALLNKVSKDLLLLENKDI